MNSGLPEKKPLVAKRNDVASLALQTAPRRPRCIGPAVQTSLRPVSDNSLVNITNMCVCLSSPDQLVELQPIWWPRVRAATTQERCLAHQIWTGTCRQPLETANASLEVLNVFLRWRVRPVLCAILLEAFSIASLVSSDDPSSVLLQLQAAEFHLAKAWSANGSELQSLRKDAVYASP